MTSKEDPDKITKRIGYSVLAIGVLFLLFFVFQLLTTAMFITSTRPVLGEVVGMEYGYTVSDRAGDTYQPIFSYIDAGGGVRRGKSAYVSSSYNYAPGSKIAIRADPADPTKVYMDDALDLWGFTLIFGGVGALFTTLGAKHLHNIKKYGRKRRRKPKKLMSIPENSPAPQT